MLKPPEITSVSLVFLMLSYALSHLALTKDEDVAVLAASVAGAPRTSKPLEGAVHRKQLGKEVSITCVFFQKNCSHILLQFYSTSTQNNCKREMKRCQMIGIEEWTLWTLFLQICIIVYYDLNWCYLLSFPPAVIRRLTFLVEIGIALIAPLPGKFCTCRRRWLLICQLKMATWPSVAVATKTSDKVDTKVTVRSRMLPTAVEATWSDGKCLRQAPKQFSIVF